MITFANPKVLWLLLILIPLFLTMLLARTRARKGMERLSDPDLKPLVVKGRSWLPWTRNVLRLGAMAVLMIALAGPMAGESAKVEFKSGDGVWILLDVSRSMGVADVGADGEKRLIRAKRIIQHVTEELAPRPIALITFSGPAYVRMPLTVDYSSLLQLIDELQTGEIFGGTDLSSAVREAVAGAEKSQRRGRFLLITDGEKNRGKSPVHAFTAALEKGFATDVIGIGSEKGGKIPLNSASEMPQYLVGPDSKPVYSRRNQSLLKSIARAGMGVYVDGNDIDGIERVINRLKTEFNLEAMAQSVPYRRFDVLELFLAIGCGLVGIEGFCWWVL